MTKATKQNTFCSLPWNSINLRSNGDLRICCNANSYTANRGVMRKDDGKSFNAGLDDLHTARNSALSKDVRATMLSGEWHPECERCRREESSGMESMRLRQSNDGDITLEAAIEHTQPDGTIVAEETALEFFDIRYGNFCNLKCRMCGPSDSHSWFEDHVKLHGNVYKDTHGPVTLTKNNKGRYATTDYDWFIKENKFLDNFEYYTKDAKQLYIVGGEPLIIEEHATSLERLIAAGTAHKIQLSYNTNLTNVTDRMMELWSHFQQINIGASIDGYGKVFEYQRAPANWDSVYANLKKINDAKTVNFQSFFAFTVTTLNVMHFPDFIKWKLDESGLDKFFIGHHMCHAPKHYNIKVLPLDIKQDILAYYEIAKEQIANSNYKENIKKSAIKKMESIESFMMSEYYGDDQTDPNDPKSSQTYLEDFIEITNNLDKIRGQNILTVAPFLSRLFE